MPEGQPVEQHPIGQPPPIAEEKPAPPEYPKTVTRFDGVVFWVDTAEEEAAVKAEGPAPPAPPEEPPLLKPEGEKPEGEKPAEEPPKPTYKKYPKVMNRFDGAAFWVKNAAEETAIRADNLAEKARSEKEKATEDKATEDKAPQPKAEEAGHEGGHEAKHKKKWL